MLVEYFSGKPNLSKKETPFSSPRQLGLPLPSFSKTEEGTGFNNIHMWLFIP